MARIEIDPNYSSPTFSRATAATDVFRKEDVQNLAAAMSVHNHAAGHGLAVGLAAGAVGNAALAANAVTTDKIADGTIQAVDIAAGIIGVNSPLIADGAINNAKLQDLTILATKIADANVTTAKIAANGVTQAWIVQQAPTGNTNSLTPVNMPGLFNLVSTGGHTGGVSLILGELFLQHSATSGIAQITGQLDGASGLLLGSATFSIANQAIGVPLMRWHYGGPLTSFGLLWNTNSGTLTITSALYSWLLMIEFKR